MDTAVLLDLAHLKQKPEPLSVAQVTSSHARLFAIVMAALTWVEERWPV